MNPKIGHFTPDWAESHTLFLKFTQDFSEMLHKDKVKLSKSDTVSILNTFSLPQNFGFLSHFVSRSLFVCFVLRIGFKNLS